MGDIPAFPALHTPISQQPHFTDGKTILGAASSLSWAGGQCWAPLWLLNAGMGRMGADNGRSAVLPLSALVKSRSPCFQAVEGCSEVLLEASLLHIEHPQSPQPVSMAEELQSFEHPHALPPPAAPHLSVLGAQALTQCSRWGLRRAELKGTIPPCPLPALNAPRCHQYSGLQTHRFTKFW